MGQKWPSCHSRDITGHDTEPCNRWTLTVKNSDNDRAVALWETLTGKIPAGLLHSFIRNNHISLQISLMSLLLSSFLSPSLSPFPPLPTWRPAQATVSYLIPSALTRVCAQWGPTSYSWVLLDDSCCFLLPEFLKEACQCERKAKWTTPRITGSYREQRLK